MDVYGYLLDAGIGFGIINNDATALYVVVEVPRRKRAVPLDPFAIVDTLGERGPIAALRTGDIINIDVKKRRLDVELPAVEIKKRLARWKAPRPRYTTGVFAKYAKMVSNASEGAVTS